jgi:hypothetical protein
MQDDRSLSEPNKAAEIKRPSDEDPSRVLPEECAATKEENNWRCGSRDAASSGL